MMRYESRVRIFVILTVFIIFGIITTSFAKESPKLIGYYSYRSATSGLKVTDIPGNLLTHVIYSFIGISDRGECQAAQGDLINEHGHPSVLSQFQILKKTYPKLVLMMAIGGWGGSGKFSEVASNESNRKRFVKSCIGILQSYNLDGIDLDWEYPVIGGLPEDGKSPQDPQNFVLLLAEFRKELNAIQGTKKVLSAAVAAYQDSLPIDASGMTQYADWLGVMTYDYYGGSSKTTGHHASLSASRLAPQSASKANAMSALNLYIREGAKPNQLILGVPFYAHSWADVSKNNNGLYQPFKGVPPTNLGEGNLNYREVIADYLPRSTYHFDPDAKAPWLYDSNRKIMVSFEDPQSLKFKADYALQSGLGGIMIWELNHDGEQHELLKTLFESLNHEPKAKNF